MKYVDLKMTSVEVKTTTRPTRAQWTREIAQDLSSFYSIDIENRLRIEIRREIRRSKVYNIFKK
jgi:hypothetical protein